ncbi:hypothetical protein Lal_00027775, partial [Lupinus albus]
HHPTVFSDLPLLSCKYTYASHFLHRYCKVSEKQKRQLAIAAKLVSESSSFGHTFCKFCRSEVSSDGSDLPEPPKLKSLGLNTFGNELGSDVCYDSNGDGKLFASLSLAVVPSLRPRECFTKLTASLAARASISAHDTVDGHATSKADLILSMTSNPLIEF